MKFRKKPVVIEAVQFNGVGYIRHTQRKGREAGTIFEACTRANGIHFFITRKEAESY